MKKTILSVLVIAMTMVGCEQVPITEYAIIPEPVKIEYQNGEFNLLPKASIAFPASLVAQAALLQEWYNKDFSTELTLSEGKTVGDLVLELDKSVLPDNSEGYILEIKSKSITIKANSEAGIIHGVQTLRQIVRKDKDKLLVQTGTITDYPVLKWRAFMLDEGRYFKGKATVLRMLDEMSQLKMNVFHWHLTDDQGWRMEIKKYPLLTEIGGFRETSEINHFHSEVFDGKPHGGFYTQEDVKEIIKYASDRRIMVVPEIEMPGHASAAIAAYPWLGTTGKQIKVPGKFGVHYDVFNVADDVVMKFLEDVLDEVIVLFPSPFIHIGGDEVKYDHWKNSPVVQKYMKEHGLKTPAELQVYFTNKISALLAGKGKRMMGWNEITGDKLHEYQSKADTDVDQKLAEGTVVQFWKGDPKLVKSTIEKGYDVVNSYHVFTYLDYSYESISTEKAYLFNPVPEGLTVEQQKRVLGLGCQMWSEFTPTDEDINKKIFPRIAAYAESGWISADKKDYKRFINALDDYFLKKWKNQGVEYGPIQTPSEEVIAES